MARLFRDDCRILVVEDEYVLAYQLKKALEVEGVAVLGPVSSEADARAVIEGAGAINGVVLDLNLGDGISWALADYLLDRGIPFLFATGYDEAVIPERFGHVDYTQKPVSAAFVAHALGCGSAA
ncbi:MAG: hypothetical protein ABS98_02700 [Lysobacteraceae bacterium SCN 69-48]|nr:MAG: hypothetical protein ABS98_02700 [Xanthomonadaceae bacterium SCN 69-48]